MADRFGQIGPEKGDFAEDCLALAVLLRAGRTVYVPLAHRMTRQGITLALSDSIDVPWAGPEGMHQRHEEAPWLFLAVEGRGAYHFRCGRDWNDAGYVAGHLCKDGYNEVDSESIKLLLDQLGDALAECEGRDPSPPGPIEVRDGLPPGIQI